jgi:hypothetical protein
MGVSGVRLSVTEKHARSTASRENHVEVSSQISPHNFIKVFIHVQGLGVVESTIV